jgi:hypothetical protein
MLGTTKVFVLLVTLMAGDKPLPPAYLGTFSTETACDLYKGMLLKANPTDRLVCFEDELIQGK